MSFQQHKIVMKQHCLDRSGQGRLPGTGNGCRQRKDEQEVKGIEEETGRGRPCKKKIKRPWESRARGAGHGCRRKKDVQEEKEIEHKERMHHIQASR